VKLVSYHKPSKALRLWSFAYKIKHGLPADKKDFAKYKAFLSGLRQISNTSEGFRGKESADPGPKLTRAAQEIMRHAATVPNYKGYSYSNYLGSGLDPLQKALEAQGIKTAVYSGKLNDKEKKKIVEDYNKGKIQHILVSSSGAEGLDLKGTKLVQVLEPHWHNAKLHQVKARGIRYKSHDHLPEEERHVHIQHFFSHPPQSAFEKHFGSKPGRSVDHAVHDIAAKKDKLNNAFLDILNGKGKKA
jgi:hypothetical protein